MISSDVEALSVNGKQFHALAWPPERHGCPVLNVILS